jgi:imidazolonepropionase-like amidohydrolase
MADAQLLESWVNGKKYQIQNTNEKDLRGSYKTKIGNDFFDLNITGGAYQHSYQVVYADSLKVTPKVQRTDNQLTIRYTKPGKTGADLRIAAYQQGSQLKGTAQWADGSEQPFEAIFTKPFTGETKKDSLLKPAEIGQMIRPFGAHGHLVLPQVQNYIIKNTTVWTNEKEGILANMDVAIENGKIKKIGKNLSTVGYSVKDGTGKHLTSGIIDEHTHIGLLSINEGGQSISAEVRTSDALDTEDVDIYRQLAGGVTAAQLLHGSANTIGGQSSLIKFKWGETAENMKIQGADPFIKFALGENVTRKAAQAGANQPAPRYPQSRMGVEQLLMDAFAKAKAYDTEWKNYNALKQKDVTLAPRRDLELETLAEVFNKKRFITCHSYVQSEINMMMKVAEAFDFRVNTFTHILEGYKLADKMAAHGVAGSTFSDWWAYKMEVRDAIPYNAAMMHRAGVVTAINSDDAEMARRLNQEAAKTIRYGGLSEEEAWKTVTLNPAKMLHLDQRMGSIKIGKDADLVLWNEHPLSIYAKPDFTMIDGAIYWDAQADISKQEWHKTERNRLIQKMNAAKKPGAETSKPAPAKAQIHSCEDERSGL